MFHRLKCLIGLHDFRVVFETLGDGHADDEKGVVCRKCGLSTVCRAGGWRGLRTTDPSHGPSAASSAGGRRFAVATLGVLALAGWSIVYLQFEEMSDLKQQLAVFTDEFSTIQETLRTERAAANKLLSALEQNSPNGGLLKMPYVVVANANVRIAPSTESGVVKTLGKGVEINVLEVLDDQKWYRIAHEGEEVGFVFGELIQPAAR